MNKIVPFSKDIVFNTDVYEINSISLEHNLKMNSNNDIEGEFIISGDYKESEIVINNEPFIYNIPFDVELDCKYSTDKIKIEIDDFNYELIDNNKMRININLSIDGVEELEEKEEPIIEIIDEDEIEVDEVRNEKDLFKDEEIVKEVNSVDVNSEEVTSIFNNFDEKDEKFVNYHVHIYRDNDTIDNIIKLYNSSKEELEEYNDLSNIIIGSKIIIPSNE